MLVETTACQSWPVFETRCGSCARTACVTRRCRQTSGQSPSPSCSTYPVPGLDSPKRLTGSESMDSYDAASAVATVRQTLLHLPNSVRLWMNNYLITFIITRITYCTVFFLHPQQPHKTTILDRELTANNYRNILDI